jgi:hypothetical protein
VVPHVLDAAGDGHVVGAERDTGRRRRHRGHRAGAHAVDGEAGNRLRQPGQQGGGAADGQPLVTDLRGGGDGDLVHPLGGQRRIAAEQLPDAADDEVVGARLGVDALRAGLAEGSAHAVDEDDLTQRAGHGTSAAGDGALEGDALTSYPSVTQGPRQRPEGVGSTAASTSAMWSSNA